MGESVSRSIGHSVSQSVSQQVSHYIGQWVSQSVRKIIRQTLRHLNSQSISQLVRNSHCQPIWWLVTHLHVVSKVNQLVKPKKTILSRKLSVISQWISPLKWYHIDCRTILTYMYMTKSRTWQNSIYMGHSLFLAKICLLYVLYEK